MKCAKIFIGIILNQLRAQQKEKSRENLIKIPVVLQELRKYEKMTQILTIIIIKFYQYKDLHIENISEFIVAEILQKI